MRLGNCEGGGFDNANRDTSMSKLEKAEGERVVTRGSGNRHTSLPELEEKEEVGDAWNWSGRKSGSWRESLWIR